MAKRQVKWGQVERYFSRRGYQIRGAGGENMIVAPNTPNANRTRNVVRVGHTSSNHAGSTVLPCYLNAIRRAFGVSVEDILND